MTTLQGKHPWPTARFATVNLKGGVGKTMVAQHVAHALAHMMREYGGPPPRVLLLDLDPSGDLSDMVCGDPRDFAWVDHAPMIHLTDVDVGFPEPHHECLGTLVAMHHGLHRDRPDGLLPGDVARMVHPVPEAEGLWICRGDTENERVGRRMIETFTELGAIERIDATLAVFDGIFDVILADAQPSVSLMADAFLRRCHRIVVPVKPNRRAHRALLKTFNTHVAARAANAMLQFGPVVINDEQLGTSVSKHFVAKLQETLGPLGFPETIKRSTEFEKLDAYGGPDGRVPTMYEYDPSHPACRIFNGLALRLLQLSPRLMQARTGDQRFAARADLPPTVVALAPDGARHGDVPHTAPAGAA